MRFYFNKIEPKVKTQNTVTRVMNTVHIGGRTNVNPDDVIACIACANYSRALMKTGKEFFVATTLGLIAARLDEKVFVRTHRTYLVNINYLKYIDSDKGEFVLLENDLRVVVSRRKKQNLIERLENLSKNTV